MTSSAPEDGSIPAIGDDDAEAIGQALEMLKQLDSTPLSEMSPLFYQHWFEQLNMTTRDLLRILGHDPDA